MILSGQQLKTIYRKEKKHICFHSENLFLFFYHINQLKINNQFTPNFSFSEFLSCTHTCLE